VVAGASELNGSVPVNAGQAGLFILVASNDRGVRDSATVWVAVDNGSTDIVFTASPAHVRSGEPATLAWHATGARAVSLAVKGGDTVDLKGQLETGSVNVNPTVKTTFVLTVDGQAREATIDVEPVIDQFQVTPEAATPGQPVTLSWKTHGANQVTLSLASVGVVDTETDQAKVAQGSFDYTVSPDLSASDVLTFELRVESETAHSVQTLSVYKMGNPHVLSWTAPTYAVTGSSFSLTWTTTLADVVEIVRDGQSIYRSPSADIAAQGSLSLPTPATAQSFQLRALDSRGGVDVSSELTVSPVGLPDPANSTFTSSDTVIANGGTPVTLAWNVPSARNLKIADSGVKAVGTVVLTAAVNASPYTIVPGQYAFLGGNSLGYNRRYTNSTGGTLSPGGTLSLTLVAVTAGTDANFAATNWTVQPAFTGVTVTNPVVANGTWLTTLGEDPSTVFTAQGPGSETGSVQLYPNRSTEYRLTGDNGVGTAVTPMSANVAVTTSAHLSFSAANVPAGATVQVTGPSIPGAGALTPLNFAAMNLPTQSFVDISSTGTEITFTPANNSTLVALPQPFQATWRGIVVGGQSINVSYTGWMKFSTVLAAPNSFPISRGMVSVLGGMSLQRTANSRVYWQLDGTGSQQRLIVQWNDIAIGPSTPALQFFTVQAQLYATGQVVLAYAKVPTLNKAPSPLPTIGAYAGDDSTGLVSPSTGQLRYFSLPMQGDVFGLFTALPQPYDYIVAPELLRVSLDLGNNHSMVIQDGETVVTPNLVTITEAMMNPVTAGNEWIEITNNTANDFDLNGWDLEFGSGSKYTFTSSVRVPASSRLVLGQSTTAPAATAVNYFSYGSTYTLPKTGAPVNLSRAKGVYSSLGVAPVGTTGTAGTFVASYAIQSGTKATGWTLPTGVTTSMCTVPTASTYGAGLFGTPGAANTTCPSYAGASTTGNFEILAGQSGTTQLTPASNDNDIVSLTLSSPARFGGVTYSKVYVGTNGFLSLEPVTCASDATGTCYANNPASLLPPATTPLAPVGFIAPFWDDLDVSTGGIYTARRTGYTIISWENVQKPILGDTYSLNFQVKLFDTGNIEFHFGTMTGTGATSAPNNAKGASASTWLMPPQGGAAYMVNTSGTAIAPNSGYRFTAQ
jgi:hypothetical protein